MVSTALVHWMARGLSAKGLNSAELLRKVRVDDSTWRSDGQMTLDEYANVLRELIRELDDEALCLLTRRSRPGAFALQARAAVSAATLEEALRYVTQAFCMLHDDLSLTIERHGNSASVRLHVGNDSLLTMPHVHVHPLCAYSRLFAWLAGGSLPGLGFDFAFGQQGERVELAGMFSGELRFGTLHSAIRFDAAALRLPVCRDVRELRPFLADGPIYHGCDGAKEGMSQRVLKVLSKPPVLWPDVASTAKVLCMSASTLQRRLAMEGTTYQALKDQLRRDTAIKHLRRGDKPLNRLAAELGFSDTAAFQRVFKKWTGVPPGAYRRVLG